MTEATPAWGKYTVIYVRSDDTCLKDEPIDHAPDIERMILPEPGISFFAVKGPQPLEANLTFINQLYRQKHAAGKVLYDGLYFPNGEIINYRTMIKKSNNNDLIEGLRDYAQQRSKIAFDFFGAKADIEPEDMLYVVTPQTSRIYPFCENDAVLIPCGKNVQGKKWRKIGLSQACMMVPS